MLKYVLKRLGIAAIILFGVSIIIYILVRMMPMDFIEQQFQAHLDQGEIDESALLHLKTLYGLEDKSFGGILRGYFVWLGNMFKGDFGTSFKFGAPVTEVIWESMWISFAIALIAFVLQFAIAIPLGIQSARKQYGAVDYTTTVLTIMGISLPSYFLAALLMKIFAIDLKIVPLQGLVDATKDFSGDSWGSFWDKVHHLILPMFIFVILSIGSLTRYTRTNTLEALNADYIRTARAKGLSERNVVYKHVFRNTMIPIVTMMAGVLPSLFSGAMIIESVFAIPGIGYKAYVATTTADVPFIMGYNMFLAVLTVIGTLLSDLMYGIVDPRVRMVR